MSPTIIISAIALGVAGFLATSGDNLVILLGLYGGRTYRPRDVFVGHVGAIGLVVVAARLFAAIGARKLVHHTGVGWQISRITPYVMPFLLIAIGLFILADTPTDVLGLVPARC